MSGGGLREIQSPMVKKIRPILITGGAGFIGSNLADRLACEGHHVLIVDTLQRPGVDRNVTWLNKRHSRHISCVVSDIRDPATALAARESAAVFHFAAQVAVTTSLETPLEDLDANVRGTVELLEAVRYAPSPVPFIFASTNKVYGDLADVKLETHTNRVVPSDPHVRQFGVSETRHLDFHTPYGCSKGAADQYVLDYARSFRVPATVLRMSCIYGPRQCGTEDQGWVAHFVMRARQRKPITLFGDGKQVRDILHVNDAVAAYMSALKNIERISSQAFNLGGGPANAVSLLDVIDEISSLRGERTEVCRSPARLSDQRYYVSDSRQIQHALRLPSFRPWKSGLADLMRWVDEEAAGHRTVRDGATEGAHL